MSAGKRKKRKKKHCTSDLVDCCNMQQSYKKGNRLMSIQSHLQVDVRLLSPPRFFFQVKQRFLAHNVNQCKIRLNKFNKTKEQICKRRGWIEVCKSADPLKLMAESVDPRKKSTKSESAITDPSRISALLVLVIFSTAWHWHIKKEKVSFPARRWDLDPNFQRTKIQNPGPKSG